MAKNNDSLGIILVLLGLGYVLYKTRKAAEYIVQIPEGLATGRWVSPYTQWKFFEPRGFARWFGWRNGQRPPANGNSRPSPYIEPSRDVYEQMQQLKGVVAGYSARHRPRQTRYGKLRDPEFSIAIGQATQEEREPRIVTPVRVGRHGGFGAPRR